MNYPKHLVTRILMNVHTRFSTEIVDYILEYLYTPIPFRIGSTYYISFMDVWGTPHFEKYTIDKIMSTSLATIIYSTKHVFVSTFNGAVWEKQFSFLGSHLQMEEKYNMYYFTLLVKSIMLGIPHPIILYSGHTTDEAKACRIMAQRLNRYTEFHNTFYQYCQTHHINLGY
jgi:hypothetical protein